MRGVGGPVAALSARRRNLRIPTLLFIHVMFTATSLSLCSVRVIPCPVYWNMFRLPLCRADLRKLPCARPPSCHSASAQRIIDNGVTPAPSPSSGNSNGNLPVVRTAAAMTHWTVVSSSARRASRAARGENSDTRDIAAFLSKRAASTLQALASRTGARRAQRHP